MAAVSIDEHLGVAIGDMTDSLQRHLRARLPSRCDAEDIAQETYVKFLQAVERGLAIENPKAYLYTIAHNLLYHHYKAEARVHIPAHREQLFWLNVNSCSGRT